MSKSDALYLGLGIATGGLLLWMMMMIGIRR
jgi:hypothetical protein